MELDEFSKKSLKASHDRRVLAAFKLAIRDTFSSAFLSFAMARIALLWLITAAVTSVVSAEPSALYKQCRDKFSFCSSLPLIGL